LSLLRGKGYIKREVSDAIQDPKTRLKWTYWRHPTQSYDVPFRELPSTTNHNHVHIALMGMSNKEWELFENLLWEGEVNGTPENETIQTILKTPESNLVAYFLEATKERVNANRP
jgi:hypothetical protein